MADINTLTVGLYQDGGDGIFLRRSDSDVLYDVSYAAAGAFTDDAAAILADDDMGHWTVERHSYAPNAAGLDLVARWDGTRILMDRDDQHAAGTQALRYVGSVAWTGEEA